MPKPSDLARARRSIAEDLALSAATGAPLLGCLGGLHRTEVRGEEFGLSYDLDRPVLVGAPGVVEVAVLADLALGGALRSTAGAGLPLPTISMTVQWDAGALGLVRSAGASAPCLRAGTSSAAARLLSAAGEVLGRAQGVFAVPARPFTGAAATMPWDESPTTSPSGTVAAQEADPDVSARIVDHAEHGAAEGWMSALTRSCTRWEPAGRGVFAPDPVMANRAGAVQGGVLFGLAVMAGGRAGHLDEADAVTASMDLLAPVSVTQALDVDTAVDASSTRTVFCDVRMSQAGRLVTRALAVFRR